MAQYYFDLRDGDAFHKDRQGVELGNIAEAQAAAAELLAGMARDLPARIINTKGCPMAVEARDISGPLFVVIFGFVERGPNSGGSKQAEKKPARARLKS